MPKPRHHGCKANGGHTSAPPVAAATRSSSDAWHDRPAGGTLWSMCGRFTLRSPAEAVAELFELADVPDISPRWNVAPTQDVPVVRVTSEDADRRCEMLRWGLIPFWADDPSIGARLINARAETVSSKPAFRSAFRQRRCLIIADGFYEWQKLERRKQPHYVHLRGLGPFGLAGLWERWEGTDADPVDSCTIITTGPNEVIAPLHDRMPVIVHPKDYAEWLDTGTRQVSRLHALLRPYPAKEMAAYPVSTRVNNPSNDVAECVEPLS